MSNIPRPRLKEREHNHLQLKRLYDEKVYRVLLFSDPHGWLCDLRAIRCISQVLQHGKFDEVCCNGDLLDLPYLSRHTKRLYDDGILSGYSEVKEVEYFREQIKQPIRNSTNALIRWRIGNHDERVTKPNLLGESQLARLAILYKHFEATGYDKMLGINPADKEVYDPSDVFTYFDMFDVVHGLSLAKNAPEKNLQEYMSSGASGHTHRLHPYYKTNRKAPYVWLEMGHTRLSEQVEYFPTGKIPDWQQGFVVVSFHKDGDKVRFYSEPVPIIHGKCYYNSIIYDGNK